LSLNSDVTTGGLAVNDEVLATYLEELVGMRSTPELVDRLEGLVVKHPGLELDIRLYRALYPFTLDKFQEEGLQQLIAGNNVLVTTPTGSGKTLVGELAIYFALMMGLRVAYTTPLKALSNQKFKDFKERYGADRVGLLTGDVAINRGAPITIMTTEVFRNMIYDQDSQNQLSNLFMVCFDEFHFMNDPDRGTVWEESVISCPPSVRILALSATMGNVDDIQGWMESIHGKTALVASDYRPVPLRYMFAMKQGVFPLFRNPNAGPGAPAGVERERGKLGTGSTINPTITRFEDQHIQKSKNDVKIGSRSKSSRPVRSMKPNPNHIIAQYSDVVDELHLLQQLPAIVFIFSRAGCEQAAKNVMQSKRKLLTAADVEYINAALARFIRANPDIPVDKVNVQMLRSGVGVHHAGLITVWKGFIEDLFNANKIKVLFATETLAAGVNMPARTTVITSVTKRINSEIVKLKTSQLLQMAGRAGRRGKDTEGSVVVMRNRFEDALMGHKILTSPIDGIKSHFKTSYSLTITLLETRSVAECKQLIERGFGAYLMQKRQLEKSSKSKRGDAASDLGEYRDILRRYTLKGAREYLKIARKLEKETRNYEFLLDKMGDSENELVQAIADYMPMGIGIELRNGESGFFLGDVKWGPTNSHSGLGVLTRDLRLIVARKEHIRTFAEASDCIPASTAQRLLDLMSMASAWEEISIAGCPKPLLQGTYSQTEATGDDKLAAALDTVAAAPEFPSQPLPGSVVRQQLIVADLRREYADHPVVLDAEEDQVLQALKYVVKLKDPAAFVGKGGDDGDDEEVGEDEKPADVYAWKMFQNVVSLLQNFEALNGTVATELGDTVGSLSADNELWLALVLRHPAVQALSEADLAGLMCGVVIDGYKASNANFRHPPSEALVDAFKQLEPMYWDLKQEQGEAGIDFPVYLGVDAAGMVQSWVNGTSWRELCKETSLDQGDVCRMLRRTVEVLRQIPNAFGVPPAVAQTAFDAAMRMDRFPVADVADTSEAVKPDTAGVGFDMRDSLNDAELFAELDLEDLLYEEEEEDAGKGRKGKGFKKKGGYDTGAEDFSDADMADLEGTDEESILKRIQELSAQTKAKRAPKGSVDAEIDEELRALIDATIGDVGEDLNMVF